MNIIFGVDIGGTDIKFGMFQEDGQLLARWQISTRMMNNGQLIFDDIVKEIRQKMEERSISQSAVLGIGCGIPGPVDNQSFVRKCVNLGITNIYPEQEITKRMGGMRVQIGNDANVAALGEMWKGSAQGKHNILLVTLGTGVGSGIIIDGKIVNGLHGLAGEIGHFTIEPEETETCSCGGTGHLNQIASVFGVMHYAKRFLQEDSAYSVLREKKDFNCIDLTDAAKKGDAVALKTLNYCMGCLAKGLAVTAHVIDPDIFLIGGGMAKAGQLLIDIIEEHYLSNLYLMPERTEIKLAALGNDAGIYGAAKMILDRKGD